MNAVRAVSAGNIKESSHSKGLIASILLMIFLLSIRDIGGFAVNKYLFLAVAAVAVCALPIDKVMCFIAFVMPLYVGLPGNYLTMIFLVRFLFSYRRIHITFNTLMLCALAGGYALIQALVTNHTGVPELMFFPGMILVMFMFSLNVRIDKSELILSYAAGVAALGLIMLIHTLQFCDFGDLLTSTNRLGSVLRAQKIEMVINVDPNYYGLFCIALISLSVKFLNGNSGKSADKISKALMILLTGICVTIGLIGLSRAFVLVAFIWLILYLLSVKKIKASLITLFSLLLVIVLVNWFMPNVFDALIERFNDNTMATGNGRTELVYSYHQQWVANISTMLFGVGIFDCEVHCMPLQVLYGGGLVFCVLFVLYMITLLKSGNSRNYGGVVQKYLPLAMTIAMSCTVPALLLINIMYPIIITELCINEKD